MPDSSHFVPLRFARSRGFTLVELLTVIAIIGILAALVIPTVGKVRETAQRTVDGSNLREIVKAELLYATDHGERLPDPSTLASDFSGMPPVYRIPAALARAGILTDPAFFFARNDPAFGGSMPDAILDPSDRSRLDADFGDGRALAWEFVGGVRLGDPPDTPVAYTRGLTPNGTWDPATGVYGDHGGYVAFLGGNVVYYDSVAGNLTSNASGRRVSDLRQAIPDRGVSPARLYGTPPAGGSLLGSPTGVPAVAGP